MSLRRFLNVAYAILVEEYQRLGIDLISALEKVSELGESKETCTVTDRFRVRWQPPMSSP